MTLSAGDFKVKWEAGRRGVQWAVVTHVPSGRTFRLKAAACVTRTWRSEADRDAWLRKHALAYYSRMTHEELPDGIRERLLEEARQRLEELRAAREFFEELRERYPEYSDRIPTVTISGGE